MANPIFEIGEGFQHRCDGLWCGEEHGYHGPVIRFQFRVADFRWQQPEGGGLSQVVVCPAGAEVNRLVGYHAFAQGGIR